MNKAIFQVTIAGDPVAAPRPRVRQVRTKDGRQFASAYNPSFYTKYRDAARYIIQEQAARERHGELLRNACEVNVAIYLPIPSSMSGKKKALAEQHLIRPITRPDVDNYLKTALDLLTGLVISDDSIVVDSRVSKFYSFAPKMVILVMDKSPEGNLL